MKNKVIIIAIATLAGLIAGYLIFGKQMGQYVNPLDLFNFTGGKIGAFGRNIFGLKAIQQKVFLTGAAGLVTGIVLAYSKRK